MTDCQLPTWNEIPYHGGYRRIYHFLTMQALTWHLTEPAVWPPGVSRAGFTKMPFWAGWG